MHLTSNSYTITRALVSAGASVIISFIVVATNPSGTYRSSIMLWEPGSTCTYMRFFCRDDEWEMVMDYHVRIRIFPSRFTCKAEREKKISHMYPIQNTLRNNSQSLNTPELVYMRVLNTCRRQIEWVFTITHTHVKRWKMTVRSEDITVDSSGYYLQHK